MAGLSTFRERLLATARKNGSWVCLGLDPVPDRLPEGARGAAGATRFLTDVMTQVAGDVCAFKPQSAYFEAMGAAGFQALADVVAHGKRLGVPVILDVKRADIGSTATAYAKAAFEVLDADAVTVNPYLGRDGVQPFANWPDRGVFVLCHTSNPSAPEMQHVEIVGTPHRRLYEHVARLVHGWDGGNLGLVAPATYPDDLARVRGIVGPDMPLLVPGVGAQGGSAADAARGANGDGEMVVVNASRSLLFADDPAAATRSLKEELARALSSPPPT